MMHDRPMVLVEAEDEEGAIGWGEAWCNFPAVGAEHRARLIESIFAPMLVDRDVADPASVFRDLTARTAVLAIQSGEPGPIAQCIAGIDMALWDLSARRASKPLWQVLGGVDPAIAVYASGLNPDEPEALAAQRRDEGYDAFKLKVGFGLERDHANLASLRSTLGPAAGLMVDANQAWDPSNAAHMARELAQFDLQWLEEPLRADTPWPQWIALSRQSPIALAGGENLAGDDAFEDAIAARALSVVQPDCAKWGGITGCLRVARRVREAGLRYCPHYLGGGIGLLASAHLLAAVGGDGALEIDANPNPLRTALWGPLGEVRSGRARLSDAAGLGVEPDVSQLRSA
jgi:D-galactarolactone cycloisomerase